MRITRSTILDIPAERAWAAVQEPRLLRFVASPLQSFEPIDPTAWPRTWAEGRYKVRLRLFGIVPIGSQWIVISKPDQGPERYRLRDNGHGSLVRRWDHVITIEPISSLQCRYTDDIEVSAGPLTPAIAAFAYLFYRHRQRRWRELVHTGFAPLSPRAAA